MAIDATSLHFTSDMCWLDSRIRRSAIIICFCLSWADNGFVISLNLRALNTFFFPTDPIITFGGITVATGVTAGICDGAEEVMSVGIVAAPSD